MTLIDQEIEDLVAAKQLIDPFALANLSNCRYNLRAGKAFRPKSGDELVINPAAMGRRRRAWSIKPSETLVIMTEETIRIPDDLYATYSQLNGLARKGLMLMNVSIVEPGYHGALSCFLVNFSRETTYLSPHEEVAKICFHRLTAAPIHPARLAISAASYEKKLIEDARLYPTSFMDIGGVEERIVERATKSVNRSIVGGGVIVAVLALWTTLEPIWSKYIWEKQGVMTTTQRQDIMKLQQELEKTKTDLAKASDDLQAQKKTDEIEGQVKALTEEVNKLKQPRARR